jgi:hypothetical protein
MTRSPPPRRRGHRRRPREPAARADPPNGAFYRAGEHCPQVDAGRTTRDSTGRTLIGRFDNGLRWQYA